jgi:predicted acyl esterase
MEKTQVSTCFPYKENIVPKKTLCLLAFAATLLPCVPVNGQTATDIVIERNVSMKTRDGVTLRADIYRPAGDGPFFVLLQRTPYSKDNTAVFARKAAERGFMVVAQDVRGRFASEGEWYPFKHEIEDGYDTVEWAAALPHSNGKVGMFGGSYVGATQMLAAIGHPPHLAGICPVVTASNYHENWTYQGGALEQWFDESWTTGLAQDTFNRQIRDLSNPLIGDQVLPLSKYPVFNLKTVSDGAGLTRTLAPYFRDWLDHPTYDVTGSNGLSRRTTTRFRFPRSPSPPGTTSFRVVRCVTLPASMRTPAMKLPAMASTCWSPSAATPATAELSAQWTSALRPRSTTRMA